MKIYMGCSLMHATEEFKQSVEDFKEMLRKQGFEVIQFLGQTQGVPNGTPEEVYEYDFNCVKECDFMIAECSFPSIGLGIEMGAATVMNKPVFGIAQKDAKVSFMGIGCAEASAGFHRYENLEEVLPIVKEKIAQTCHSGAE